MTAQLDAEAAALVRLHGGIRKAAAASGIPYTTMQARSARGKDLPPVSETVDDIEFPVLPESELPVEDIIKWQSKNFTQALVAREKRRWMEIKVKSNQPIAVCFMGDPHIDNAGCNWPLLEQHVKILSATKGMYAIGGNDITDNWVGRLVNLYSESKVSKKQAWKVVKWLFRDSGVKWLVHVMGNHDVWNDGQYLLKAAAEDFVPVEDWQARFQLVFPNGKRAKIHMAHDFKGSSIWNHLHGAQREALLGEEADIYACAHRHCWAMHSEENQLRGYIYWLIRSRGYKYHDSYADRGMFGHQKYGASVTAIIDPCGEGPKKVTCFADLAEAADFLTWKRARA
jgi:hypothetical protein